MNNKQALLEVRDLVCMYGRHEILKGVGFSLPKGSLCGLLGPNGSGKTTLFRCILKFHANFSGLVKICGQNAASLSPAKLARLISYVPQDHRAAFPFSLREVVTMGRTPHMGASFRVGSQHEEAAEKAIELLGIKPFAQQAWNSLSGGQRQLGLIARAVAQEAPVMLLDEPTSALDFKNQIEVWKVLRKLATMGFTILACCHDPNHILWYCKSALLLKEGKIIAAGQPEDALTETALATLYGNICQMEQLVGGRQTIYPKAFEEV